MAKLQKDKFYILLKAATFLYYRFFEYFFAREDVWFNLLINGIPVILWGGPFMMDSVCSFIRYGLQSCFCNCQIQDQVWEWNLLRSSCTEAPSGLRGREGCRMKKVHVVQVQMDCMLPANQPTLSLYPSCKPVSVRMHLVTEGQRGPVGISGVA